jgi:hypothetical protein
LIPEEAFILFPPGFAALSNITTLIPLATSSEAVESPARPEPTTMACLGLVDEDIVAVGLCADWEGLKDLEARNGEKKGRQSMEMSPMRSEIEMMRSTRLRLIE